MRSQQKYWQCCNILFSFFILTRKPNSQYFGIFRQQKLLRLKCFRFSISIWSRRYNSIMSIKFLCIIKKSKRQAKALHRKSAGIVLIKFTVTYELQYFITPCAQLALYPFVCESGLFIVVFQLLHTRQQLIYISKQVKQLFV